jgi:beta-glucanase (GH16 family)
MANTINSTNNLTSTKIPQLYIRYFNPKIKANETITIRYYVSDSTQAEYLNKDDSKTFTTIVKIKDKTYNKTTKAGEYSIDIGSIATTGETYFSIQTIDDNGVASIEQFFDILIVNDSYNQVNNYNMTTADLSTYNITVGATANTTQAKANNTGLNNLFKAVENKGHNKITMLNKVYMLDYHSDKVVLPDHFTVDMNGATFKATQCNDINVSNLVDLKDCFDSHVKNGKLIGNYDGFDFEATKTNTNYNIPGEGLAVAEINGARYSSFENMEMGYSVGYNLGVFGGKLAGYVGTPGQLAFPNAYYINDQGNTVSSTTMSTTELIDISTLLDRGEIQCNVYLGYGGLALNKAELFFHFYDSQSAYKTTIKTRQYQVVKIPSGSKSMRITGFTPTTTSSGMTICHTGGATNCELINVKSYNTRTCAMHPGIYNHLLIKNCSFNYVADENEYKVTKLALDFEDGYENGKNLFFINNEVYNGTSALTIQRGFNCNVINCRNFGLDLRGHIKGANIKNNFFNDGSIYTTSFESQSHIKLHNNTFLKVLKFLKWDDTGDYSTIGLTKLDCKQNYQNNSNINVIIDKAVESSSGGEITPETLTISNIENMTQTEQTEFYIQYTTNIAVTKHEVSWDGGNTFYDKTSDVEVSGTNYKFKHDNKGNAGTYQMAIRVTTAKGTTKTSNVFTVTLTSASTPEPSTIGNMTYGKGVNQTTHVIKDDAQCWATINPVTVEQGATYTLQMDATWTWAYAYDDNDKFVKELFTSTGNNNYKYTFTAPTTKIRYGCYDPGKYLTYCNLTKNSTALTISNIENITQSEKTEFYIAYSTNIAVVKHEVSWDGGNTFYDKTSDVEVSGTNYKFKHDNSATAGTYSMAIRVTDSNGNTKTSNVFTVTLTSTSTPTPVYELTSDTVFDGTSKYVDTGVKLFQTASDHTLFIDFDDYGASQNSLAHLFHCAYENADGDGLKVYYNNEDNHYYIIGNRQNTSDGTYESSWTLVGGQNNKIAISISKGVVSNIVINGATVAVTKNEYDMNDYSLILGAYQDVQGNKSKYWKGTIHACKVWNSAFTVAEMKELFGSSSGGGSGDGYRPGRTLIWEDDFTGTTLNRANWDYENNYSRPNEVQNYVAGTNNVWVENSNLVIKAKRESSNGKEWSSGCIHTDNKREFMYGRFEAKIKIPQTVGSFPAFWTLGGNYEEGNGITWPYCGEIDIMEHKYGYAWTTAGALYRTDLVWDNWDAKDLGRVDSGNIGSFDDYHVYAMEWTANKLDYYVDDRLIGHSDISDDSQWFMFHQPHYILLNQALGAAGGSVPSDMTEYTMYVDWVRVYAPEEAPSGGGTSNQIWFEDTSARSMGKWSKLGLILKFNESWTNKVVTWKSSNTDIATVCGGRVDSKGTAGSCVITATTLEGNEASITVNVS